MKTYAIYDEDWKMKCPIGYLYYYDKCNEFIIELSRELDKWEAPLLFSSYVEKSIYTIPKEVSMLWVRERVIPSGRQNIGSILKNHKMKSYDEMKLLESEVKIMYWSVLRQENLMLFVYLGMIL